MDLIWDLLYYSAIGIPSVLFLGITIRCLDFILETTMGWLGSYEDPSEIPKSKSYQSNERLIFPAQFGRRGFMTSDTSDASIEENSLAPYGEKYAAVTLGEAMLGRWQIVGKLGWGETASAWLARDVLYEKYAVAKMYKREQSAEMELVAFDKIEMGNPDHLGRKQLRRRFGALNHIRGEGEWHETIIQEALGSSLSAELLDLKYDGEVPMKVIKSVVYQVLLALDYLHTECHLIHAGIHGENVFLDQPDDSVIDEFVRAQLRESQWKGGDLGEILPHSKLLGASQDIDGIKLGGLGRAVDGNVKQEGDIGDDYWKLRDESRTRVYQAPELYYKGGYSYSADIWSLGCWTWELMYGRVLFGDDRVGALGYQSVAWTIHKLLGPPPYFLRERMLKSRHFDKAMFEGDDEWCDPPLWPGDVEPLLGECRLGDDESWAFFDVIKDMIQWRPEDRKTAREMLMHPWFSDLDVFYTRQGLDPELHRKPKVKPESEPESRPKSELELEPELSPKPSPKSKPELKPESTPESSPELAPAWKPQLKPESSP